MTEDEAKKKVCPVGAMRGTYDGNWDKGSCIGSACMAWRPLFEDRGIHGSHVKSGGYCGLVGKST